MIAKPTSIKGTGGKSGGCAWKAIELTSGDLLHVTESRLRVEQSTLTVQQRAEAAHLAEGFTALQAEDPESDATNTRNQSGTNDEGTCGLLKGLEELLRLLSDTFAAESSG